MATAKDVTVNVTAKVVTSGASQIHAERIRVLADEGFTPEHDDEHDAGQLLDAAMEYVRVALGADPTLAPNCWPWDESWWKPSDDPIRNLVKAGALIAAEIDRLQRAAACPCRTAPSREAAMVVIDPGTPERHGRDGVWCDPCIASIVAALNAADIRTVASCCGHGHRPGRIDFADGRALVVTTTDAINADHGEDGGA